MSDYPLRDAIGDWGQLERVMLASALVQLAPVLVQLTCRQIQQLGVLIAGDALRALAPEEIATAGDFDPVRVLDRCEAALSDPDAFDVDEALRRILEEADDCD